MSSMFDYSAFEEHFRGDAREIRRKLSAYVPLLRQIRFDESSPALDIGCGRGEWLSLLVENGIPAYGVDNNADFVASCRKDGLNVQEQDLYDYLDDRPGQQYALISGFHVIEHFDIAGQQAILRKAWERLAPGGVLLLETPNPENTTVGSCNFYIDPTHVRPVPPPLLEYLAIDAGFVMPRILRINRATLGISLPSMPDGRPNARTYNRLLQLLFERVFQAPDYALVAFKGQVPGNGMLQAIDAINAEETRCTESIDDVRFQDDPADPELPSGILKDEPDRDFEQIARKNQQLAKIVEELESVRQQLNNREAELRSIESNEIGKLLMKYKKWKRRRFLARQGLNGKP